jgi:hypothetical protein
MQRDRNFSHLLLDAFFFSRYSVGKVLPVVPYRRVSFTSVKLTRPYSTTIDSKARLIAGPLSGIPDDKSIFLPGCCRFDQT